MEDGWQPVGVETKGTPATLNVEVADHRAEPSPEHADLVHTTWRRIDWLTHYDLLAIPRSASAEDVRRAYFDRSRLFHPDLAHRADLVGLDRELSAVFERLKVAHDTLADDAARAEYDRTLDDAPAVVFAEDAVADPQARRQLAAKNFDRALQLIEEKDYYSAVELLREAVRFAPDKPEYRFRLGEVEIKNEKWVDRGIENLREADEARSDARRVPSDDGAGAGGKRPPVRRGDVREAGERRRPGTGERRALRRDLQARRSGEANP